MPEQRPKGNYHPPIEDERRARIVALVADGHGVCETARLVGCHPSTVSRIRTAEGIGSSQSLALHRATLQGRQYARGERIRLLNESLAAAEALLPTIRSAAGLVKIAQTISTLCAAMRDEERAAAAEQESAEDTEELRARLLDRMKAIAERDATGQAAPPPVWEDEPAAERDDTIEADAPAPTSHTWRRSERPIRGA